MSASACAGLFRMDAFPLGVGVSPVLGDEACVLLAGLSVSFADFCRVDDSDAVSWLRIGALAGPVAYCNAFSFA